MAVDERLDPERLFSVLDLDAPGLQGVQAAVGLGDIAQAEEELLTYMRNRENVRTEVPWRSRDEHRGAYASETDLPIADDAIRHIFGGHEGDPERLLPAHQFGEEIDWKHCPVKDREWGWHLNMMPFWSSLARAYWHTGDERYAREFLRQIDGWVVRERPDGNMMTWRQIDAGIRAAGAWSYAYYHFLTSPSLTARLHTHILLGFYEHAVFLHSHEFTVMNHGLFEARGLFFISVLFPEFTEAHAWLENSAGYLSAEIVKQVASDGGHGEMCPSYHTHCIDIFEAVLTFAQLNDVELPEAYVERLRKMYEFVMLTSLPDGTLPRIGDTWRQGASKHLGKGAELFEREDMKYVATARAEGDVPQETSVCLEPSGFCVMRDGWGPRSQYLLTKWKYGGWHSHFDEMSIILASHGRTLLDDSSTIDFHGGGRPESRATHSHSTIAIQGRDRPSDLHQTRLGDWSQTADTDYIDMSGPLTPDGHVHRRRIAYVRGKYWVMVDDVSAEAEATDRVDMYFQFAPGKISLEGLTARTDFDQGANLMVKVLEVPGLTAHEEEGWIATHYKVVQPRPRVRFSVSGLPVTLVSLLYPYEGEPPAVTMKRVALPEDTERDGVLGLRVSINGKEDLIFFAPDGRDFSHEGSRLVGPLAYLDI